MTKLFSRRPFAIIINVLFAVSMGTFSFLVSSSLPSALLRFGAGLLSFLITLRFACKNAFAQRILGNCTPFQAMLAFALGGTVYRRYCVECTNSSYYLRDFLEQTLQVMRIGDLKFSLIQTMLQILLAAAIFCMFCIFLHYVQPQIKAFFAGLSKAEKWYLIISCTVWIALSCWSYSKTSIFYNPYDSDGRYVGYDVLYNTDSGLIYANNCYSLLFGSENDVRQLLFGVFSIPFAALAELLDYFVFYEDYGYALGLVCVQIVVMRVTILCVARMAVDEVNVDLRPWFWLVMDAAFSTMLFSLCLEQYVFPVFWAVLLIYAYLNKRPGRDMLYIAATGSLITTGILFPLITDRKNLSGAAADIGKAFLKYCAILLTFGCAGYMLFEAAPRLQLLLGGSYHIPFLERLFQYTRFSSVAFLYPPSCTNVLPRMLPSSILIYEMQPVMSLCISGVVVLALAGIGFALNRKNHFARICFAWVLLSAVIILVAGWGTSQNATIVYSYYFGWAFVSLVFMALQSLCKRSPTLLKIALGVLIAAMLVINVSGGANILRFAFTYYG